MCVKDCGLYSQNNQYDIDKFFACFIGKLDSSHVKTKKKN